MKIILLTSTAQRHKYIGNILAKQAESMHDILIFSEEKATTSNQTQSTNLSPEIEEHFMLRDQVELDYFKDDNHFMSSAVYLKSGEINHTTNYDKIKKFQPDLVFVFC